MKKNKYLEICSWNVNGIRASFKKGLLDFINETKYDLYFFQEIKADQSQVPLEIIELDNYSSYWFSAEKKGYSGVGLLVKNTIKDFDVEKGINIQEFDSEGRSITINIKNISIIGAYYPNGQRDHGRVPYKLKFSNKIEKYATAKNKNVIITGDFNTSHHEIDLKNPKANTKSTGFLPIEREYLDKFCKHGYIDTFRHFHPGEEGHYTWWTYRNDCRKRNIGWRLDYFFTNQENLKNIEDVKHHTEVLGSDHCPIYLKVKI